MTMGLERIAAKARQEPKLRFTSLAHHVTEARVWGSLCHIPSNTAPGCDGRTVVEEKEGFGEWIEPMLRSVHRKCYRPPPIRRVYIPKPGKREKRPLGVPCVADRALQRSVAEVLASIYEQDFLPCSFGGRRGLGAHNALATLRTVVEEKEGFGEWIEPMLRSVHRKCYRPPPIRRVYIPKPGKREKRPLGVPCVADRALQRSVTDRPHGEAASRGWIVRGKHGLHTTGGHDPLCKERISQS